MIYTHFSVSSMDQIIHLEVYIVNAHIYTVLLDCRLCLAKQLSQQYFRYFWYMLCIIFLHVIFKYQRCAGIGTVLSPTL